ncbi:MAG: hypothetical protein ACLFPR_11955, partial [Desulfococcaceae bacterium]
MIPNWIIFERPRTGLKIPGGRLWVNTVDPVFLAVAVYGSRGKRPRGKDVAPLQKKKTRDFRNIPRID